MIAAAIVTAMAVSAYLGAYLVAGVNLRDLWSIWQGEPRPTIARARARDWEAMWARRGYERAQGQLLRARARLRAQDERIRELEAEVDYLAARRPAGRQMIGTGQGGAR